jgi:hypothetical protein
MVDYDTQECMTVCNYKTDIYRANDMFQMQSHTLYQNIIFMTGYNSFNRKHLQCINFTLTKKGDVSQEVISTRT